MKQGIMPEQIFDYKKDLAWTEKGHHRTGNIAEEMRRAKEYMETGYWVLAESSFALMAKMAGVLKDQMEREKLDPLEWIEKCVAASMPVCWKNSQYRVVRNKKGDLVIQDGHTRGKSEIPLCWSNSKKLIHSHWEFFILQPGSED